MNFVPFIYTIFAFDVYSFSFFGIKVQKKFKLEYFRHKFDIKIN